MDLAGDFGFGDAFFFEGDLDDDLTVVLLEEVDGEGNEEEEEGDEEEEEEGGASFSSWDLFFFGTESAEDSTKSSRFRFILRVVIFLLSGRTRGGVPGAGVDIEREVKKKKHSP